MAATDNLPIAELGLDESPVDIVSESSGRPDAVLHTLVAWQAPGYMIALALAFGERRLVGGEGLEPPASSV